MQDIVIRRATGMTPVIQLPSTARRPPTLADPRLRRVLFRLAMALTACLTALVFLCPIAVGWELGDGTAAQAIRLFARDPMMRQTTVVAALGIYLTALVCFRQRPEPTIDHGPDADS